MAHVISSLRPVEERLWAFTQTHPAAAKTRPRAAQTDTATAATSFRGLFPGKAPAAAPAVTPPPAQTAAPTAQSVFGANPWVANPTGSAPDGSSYSFNPVYFATAATASQVAQMVGGKVVASNQLASAGSPFVQQQPNQMVELANGTQINAGLVASFYTHGYPQSYIDQLIANEVFNSAT